MHDLVNDFWPNLHLQICVRGWKRTKDRSHMLERSRHISYSMGLDDFKKIETQST